MVCTRDTQSCWQSSKKINPCCTDKLREMLINVTDVFDELDILYWIDFGTLLGAIRHQDIIPWDYDVDLCIMKKNLQKVGEKILPVLEERFSYVCRTPTPHGHIIEYSQHNKLRTDIYTWKILNDNTYEHVCRGFASPIRQFSRKYINHLQTINFLGKDFKIPNFAKEKLTKMYGNWKKVNKKTPYW